VTGPTVSARLPVEAGKVAEFARAIGLDQALVREFAPPTFPVVIEHHGASFTAVMAGLGYALGGVLHGEEDVHFPNGAVAVGETLEGEITLLDRTRKRGRSGPLELVRFRLELRRPGGELAVVVLRTLVVQVDRSTR
jgi:hypothetical protein